MSRPLLQLVFSVFYVVLIAGIAFPTCISVNNCICHFSPLKSDPELLLKDGDMVKMYDITILCRRFYLVSIATFVLVPVY